MATEDHSSDSQPANSYSGSSDNVIQARDIRGDVHLHTAEPHRAPVPRQLPADTAHFVNRASELAQLDGYLDAKESWSHPVVISAIAGTAGAGKTALAVHWGHQVRDLFPDGDLYVNLRGYDSAEPISTEQALQSLLQGLGIPSRSIPTDTEAQSGLYRSVLNNRRMLIVLDNAASPEQVRPLLPAAPGSLTLVTSRSRLSGLTIREGAHAMSLDLLSVEESLTLLRATIGHSRVDDEPEAGAELARRCCYLPLALRIVAERAVNNPSDRLADLVAGLAAEHDQLDVLSTLDDDANSMRAVFSWSYRALPDEAARAFRLLGLHPRSDISLHAAAALLAAAPAVVRRRLEILVNAHLLERISRDRYRIHDLLHAYSTERAEEESENAREAALDRLFGWYLHTTDYATRKYTGDDGQFPISLPSLPSDVQRIELTTIEDARSWLDSEESNIAHIVRSAARTGRKSIAWRLPVCGTLYFRVRRLWSIWSDALNTGLAAARDCGDTYGEAAILNCLGVFHRAREEYEHALAHFDEAREIWEHTGNKWEHVVALNNIGPIHIQTGHKEKAAAVARHARDIWREIGDRWGEADAEYVIGIAQRDSGRLHESLDSLGVAHRLMSDIGQSQSESAILVELADTHRLLGAPEVAVDLLQQARTLSGKLNDRWTTAKISDELGHLFREQGRVDEAREAWLTALSDFESEDPERATEIRIRLDHLPKPDGRTA